jgi:rubrerythrin
VRSGYGNFSRIERARQPGRCPSCDAQSVARILYGYPAFSTELDEDLKTGMVVLGGCVITDDDPVWQCTACGQGIHRLRVAGQ